MKDWPVEQYARDAKIFSIYEGTSHIQAMDLVGRKLGQHGGANFQAFMNDINTFVEAQRAHPAFGKEAEMLGQAAEAVTQLAMAMLGWSQAEKMNLLVLNANRFLTMMSQLSVGWLLLDAGVILDLHYEPSVLRASSAATGVGATSAGEAALVQSHVIPAGPSCVGLAESGRVNPLCVTFLGWRSLRRGVPLTGQSA